MNLDRIKILPLLVMVAMLAFSVRVAEVVTGVSSLGGSAFAEEAPVAAPENADKDNASEGEQEAAVPKPKVERPAPIEIADDAEAGGEPDGDWRDASDDEIEYRNVKLEMFDDLSERRKTLDKREKGITAREALLKAAEQELDRKYQELSHLRTKIEGLLEQQSEEEQARIASLVKIYEGMKPKDAARIFDTLDLDVLVSVLSRMSERKLSPILAAMNPERARTVTIMLAEQKQLPQLPQVN